MFQGLGKSQRFHKAPNSLGKATWRIKYFLRGLGEAYGAVPLYSASQHLQNRLILPLEPVQAGELW